MGIATNIDSPLSIEMDMVLSIWLENTFSIYTTADRVLLAHILSIACPIGGAKGELIRKIIAADVIRYKCNTWWGRECK